MTDDFNEEKLCHFDPFSLRTANYFDNMIMNDAILYDLYELWDAFYMFYEEKSDPECQILVLIPSASPLWGPGFKPG